MRILFLLREKTEDVNNIFFIIRGVYLMKGKKKKHGKSNAYQRRQQRYFEKKKSQKVDIIPRKLSASQLADYIEKFEPLVELANKRIQTILEAGYNSLAIDRVEQQTGREYFDLYDIKNREDLISRITAVRVFLADKGSTLEGAKLEMTQIATEKYKGKFGNQYNKEEYNFARYDINVIDKEIAERAFENYRKIESWRASQIGRQGQDGVYGSENLIIAMYDAEIRGLDSYAVGNDLLDAYVKESNTAWKPIENEAESTVAISGYYLDNLKRGLNF